MNRDSSVAGLASLVQSRGRNGDSVLVHMSPEEVHGLQRVALAAGGSLSVNPDTGLLEANFLKKLLPTLLGFGLNFLFPGLGAIGSGLLVGGVEAARTGDLGKGLMAGLGAFGGAGLGSALSTAGSQAATAATSALAPEAATTQALSQLAPTATSYGSSLANLTGAEAIKTAGADVVGKALAPEALKNVAAAPITGANLSSGVAALRAAPGATLKALGSQMGTAGVAGLGMNVANAFTPDYQMSDLTGQIDDSYYQSEGYDPVTGAFRGGQWRKGYPGFPGYAEGGSVMPRTNYNYPQAGITRSSYAPNLDYTRPQEVVDGYEVKIDPFTGEERFADGGAVGVAPGAVAGDPMVNLTNTSYTAPALPPQQTLEQYYQGLLTPPPAQSYDPSFMNYMQSLNRFVTSPVAPPPPPPPPPPPKDTTTPPSDRTGPPGTRDKFDPSMIDFSKIDFSNFNFGDFMGGQYGDISQYMTGGDSRMTWDPTQGRFVTQTPTRTTGTTTTTTDTQNQYDPSKFDPSQYRFNPFEDGFNREYAYPIDQTDNIAYEDNAYMADQLPADFMNSYLMQSPSGRSERVPDFSQFDYAGATPGFDMGNFQLGDMSGYGTQFQGFQPLSTDFGSTYQPPAMNTPMFNAQTYAPQQTDFGSMGDYGLGALGTTYSAPTFQMPSFDFGSQAAAVPTTSFQAPMTTGMDSTAATAPQFGFGNSDVLYGQANFGQGGEQNIFGFAEGGAIQKAAAGKLVTGDGDGMSDDIRANINGDQEARLADGEFVIPADVVSHIGNGSTDAGADKLYTMMDRIRKARTGRTQQAPEIDAEKYFPA